MHDAAPALEMLDVSKTFPSVPALDEVSFAYGRGGVHAQCGENGAGKSTLIKILDGVYQLDGGAIRLAPNCIALLPVARGSEIPLKPARDREKSFAALHAGAGRLLRAKRCRRRAPSFIHP